MAKPSGVPTALKISNASWKKPKPLLRYAVVSALFFAVKACTPCCWPLGGQNEPKFDATMTMLHAAGWLDEEKLGAAVELVSSMKAA